IGVAQPRYRDAARVQIPLLAERHQLLDHRTQILGLGERGDDLLVLDQRLSHIGEHGDAVFRRAIEAALLAPVIRGASLVFTAPRAPVGPFFVPPPPPALGKRGPAKRPDEGRAWK